MREIACEVHLRATADNFRVHTRRKLVDLTIASWNRIAGWLSQLSRIFNCSAVGDWFSTIR